jgi:D-tyrosyl-tRNA(Tyr) deacylase
MAIQHGNKTNTNDFGGKKVKVAVKNPLSKG